MRRLEVALRSFQAPVNVQASADGRVYLFQDRADALAGSSSEEEEEELLVRDLRPRGREWARPERERAGDVLLLERDVTHGDNLNKLALQYGCKVADIKRVNNLIREQDLYALKSIRIPVKRHGLLTEANGELREPQPLTQLQPAHSPAPESRPQEYTDFLKEIDRDIEKLIQTGAAPEEGASANGLEGTPRTRGGQIGAGYGADWGIRWWNAVAVMLLIGVILPLFYVVYYKTQDGGTAALNHNMTNTSLSTSNSTGTYLSTAAPRESLPPVVGKPLT
ncbi:lysM and putative peptidoglycan-binding domain-containing protein 4-like [Megalops cyprinoides]|uniref:lysM and putative peptidoglycan-binding domain-containing protein 4-like n=1 Tax=Megalops cyprinoides TaxID=118141 RepID=UPI0018640182|nr:lysM and putative peptidoglycan-binding domain-containing protein 4-like [Megalops cyprinoides]XP_036399937.1 lysM and putative peptidoglycan-binding domain-containing protein 4-like [Megalops cyprinoides]